jgi:hypothetical protein
MVVESRMATVLSYGVASASDRDEDPMLQIPRPTPTCTRFKSTTEMPCLRCGQPMRLALLEPGHLNFNLLTYRCAPCASDESFLKSI